MATTSIGAWNFCFNIETFRIINFYDYVIVINCPNSWWACWCCWFYFSIPFRLNLTYDLWILLIFFHAFTKIHKISKIIISNLINETFPMQILITHMSDELLNYLKRVNVRDKSAYVSILMSSYALSSIFY